MPTDPPTRTGWVAAPVTHRAVIAYGDDHLIAGALPALQQEAARASGRIMGRPEIVGPAEAARMLAGTPLAGQVADAAGGTFWVVAAIVDEATAVRLEAQRPAEGPTIVAPPVRGRHRSTRRSG